VPSDLITKDIWKERFQGHPVHRALPEPERGPDPEVLSQPVEEGTEAAFLERFDIPEKNWKVSPSDVKERGHWNDYMHAYEELIRETSTKEAPWYVIPADNKWFTRVMVAAAVIDGLSTLDLNTPSSMPRSSRSLQLRGRN
jgi:hypothetical protein